jgi:hypothetical protein
MRINGCFAAIREGLSNASTLPEYSKYWMNMILRKIKKVYYFLLNTVINKCNDVKEKMLWWTEAHKESIKYIHYSDIEPNIIITTSHDLKVKLFLAENGKYIDELKQIANKFNEVPIGIIYRGEDPITSKKFDLKCM